MEPYELELMREYNIGAQQAEDWASLDKWDELFHRTIAEASGYGLMISTIDQIFRIKKKTPLAITRAKTFDPSLRDRYCFHHLALISAIAKASPSARTCSSIPAPTACRSWRPST
jgi:DNA-binding GntR family transcriptional regulator